VTDDPSRGWEVFTHGGRTPTGLDAVEWAARMEDGGAGEILLTSMDRDGTKLGYDLELTRRSSTASASRDRVGRRGLARRPRGGLERGGASAALVASLFH
jgi:cyclase